MESQAQMVPGRRVGGREIPHMFHDTILSARSLSPSRKISKEDLEAGKRKLAPLFDSTFQMQECASGIYLGKSANPAEDLKKLSYVLALFDFISAVNKKVEKEPYSDPKDYAIFCDFLSQFSDSLKENYFSKSLQSTAYSRYALESVLEACSEMYGLGPMLFEEASAKYMGKAKEFVEETRRNDTEKAKEVSARAAALKERLENGQGGIKHEIENAILKALQSPGARAVRYRFFTVNDTDPKEKEPSEAFVLFSKGDNEEMRAKKLDIVGEKHIASLRIELEFLEEVAEKLRNSEGASARDRRILSKIEKNGFDQGKITAL